MTAALVRKRYASAVNAKSLVVDERTYASDSDLLAAMGFADRALTTGKRWSRAQAGEHPRQENITPSPLAVSLARLFNGDKRAVHATVRIMSQLAYEHSKDVRVKIARHAAFDLARACFAWKQHGTCKSCGGHGYDLIPGAPALSDRPCKPCGGTGKRLLAQDIDPHRRNPDLVDLARWLLNEMERAEAMAFPEAARSLAPKLDL